MEGAVSRSVQKLKCFASSLLELVLNALWAHQGYLALQADEEELQAVLR